jgi:hypothetical protein
MVLVVVLGTKPGRSARFHQHARDRDGMGYQPTVTVVVRALWPGDKSEPASASCATMTSRGWKLQFFSDNITIPAFPGQLMM